MTAATIAAMLVLVVRPDARPQPQPRAVGLDDIALLLELAVAGGLSLFEALQRAAKHLDRSAASEIAALVRSSRHAGLANALGASTGTGAELFRPLARAVHTGAALQPLLAALRRQFALAELAEFEARLERLPVKLVFPLALLMLPGLLLMIVAPVLIDVLGRFG